MSASGLGVPASGDDAEIGRLSTWSGFVGPLDEMPVSDVGRRIVGEAVDIVREFFTDHWLAASVAARSVPMMSLFEWPLTVPRCVVGFLELAARIAVLEPTGIVPLIGRQLRPTDRSGEFEHLRLVLEVAGLAHRAGWSIEVERATPSGSRPDLTLTRGGETVQLEVTNQGHSRRVRAVVEFSHDVRVRCWAVEAAHNVRCVVTSEELVTTDDLDEWFHLADEAAAATASDGQRRVVEFGPNQLTVMPAASEVQELYRGPVIGGDAWAPVDARLRQKAKQTAGGGLTWIRLDITPDLFMLTSLAPMGPPERLAAIQQNVTASLQDAPHVAGVVMSYMAIGDKTPPLTYVAKGPASPTLWLPDSTQRELAIAHGPAAMLRTLPGDRARISFILSGAATELGARRSPLGLGAWYDDEGNWLAWAFEELLWPSLDAILL
jgi:hypothetical protein